MTRAEIEAILAEARTAERFWYPKGTVSALCTALLESMDRVEELERTVAACDWYWPADDTSSDASCESAFEVIDRECVPPGVVWEVARGGVVEHLFCAWLAPAPDADSDDEFWVEEATEADAQIKIGAELARRKPLAARTTGEK